MYVYIYFLALTAMIKQSFELLLRYWHSQLVTAVHHKHHCLHATTHAHTNGLWCSDMVCVWNGLSLIVVFPEVAVPTLT